MLKVLPTIISGLPIIVFLCSYSYSWTFFRRLLGDYNFLVSIQDYVIRGAAAIPILLSVTALVVIDLYLDLRIEKEHPGFWKREQLRISPKWRSYFALAFFTASVIFMISFAIFTRRFELIFILISILVLGIWFLPARKSFSERKWAEFYAVTVVYLVASAAFLGFYHAGMVLEKRHQPPNRFEVGSETIEAEFLASVGGGHLIRFSSGDFYMRMPENKERIFLFKYNAPEPRTMNDFIRWIKNSVSL